MLYIWLSFSVTIEFSLFVLKLKAVLFVCLLLQLVRKLKLVGKQLQSLFRTYLFGKIVSLLRGTLLVLFLIFEIFDLDGFIVARMQKLQPPEHWLGATNISKK